MSLTSIGSIPATTGLTRVTAVGSSTSGGGVVPFSTGATAAGGYIAQGSGAADGSRSLLKKMLVGGVVGAGLGFGATFIHPLMNLITGTSPVGWGIKAAAAGIGAAVGAGAVLIGHVIGKRKQNLAMQAQAQAGAMPPNTSPAGGATLRMGARGPAAKKLQADLHTLGIYSGKLTGAFDAGTAEAVRRYEVMKGVVPTGRGSADLRAAVAQDVSLMRQYA